MSFSRSELEFIETRTRENFISFHLDLIKEISETGTAWDKVSPSILIHLRNYGIIKLDRTRRRGYILTEKGARVISSYEVK